MLLCSSPHSCLYISFFLHINTFLFQAVWRLVDARTVRRYTEVCLESVSFSFSFHGRAPIMGCYRSEGSVAGLV